MAPWCYLEVRLVLGAFPHFRISAPPAKSKMAARGPQNGRRGLERCFLIHALLLREKDATEEKKKRENREKNGEKKEKRKRQMKIVATTSLPAVNRPNADRWNAARSCQFCGVPCGG